MPFPFKRTDIWREGKYLDLWSVVHFLSGVATACVLALFHFGALAAFVIAFLVFVAYELWEAMVSIHETPQNRVMDVVVGFASFVPTYLLVLPTLDGLNYVAFFAFIAVADVAMSTFGWLASRKAAELEQRMRAEYTERIARLRSRRAARRVRAMQRR